MVESERCGRAKPMGAAAELTSDQQAALSAFVSWLEGPADGGCFVLRGFAGSGKTYLAMRLLRLADRAGLCWTVVAPTHKAVAVLHRQLERARLRPTWYPSTLHRLLRLKLRRHGDQERCEETAQSALALEHLGLVLIDEASMVDSQLLEITLRAAHPFQTRLVFVGDPAQLPPVGEAESPVFSLKRAHGASLGEVVRHQGPVLRLATGLRQGSLPCRCPPILVPVRSPMGEVAMLDRQAWLQAAQAALRRSSAEDNPDLARILCYTNRTIERLVPIARRALHGEMADQVPVLPGEVLISRQAVMAPACHAGGEVAEEPDLVLASNQELLVRDVKPESCDLASFGAASAETVIETWQVTVDHGPHQLVLRLQPPIGSAGRQQLDQALQRLRQEAAAAGKSAGRALWRRFFLLRDAFAALGPAAVLSVHRAQGSTFEEVFVAADVFRPSDERLRRQLVYVAVSRASRRVVMAAEPGSAAARRLWLARLAEPEQR
jgi:exodeoxyribonuclease-5